MAEHILAIDQGTTSTRAIIFDRFGQILSSAQIEHHQHYPQPGWVEHDATEIWTHTQKLIQECLKRAQLKREDLAAVGITNQRETFVIWDSTTGEPLHPAIVWQDTRSSALCEQLKNTHPESFWREKTGLPITTYFSAPKLRWLLETYPGTLEALQQGKALFGTMDTWLIYQLTQGLHVTDPTNASRTQLMNLRSCDWDPELLEIFKVPRCALPTIRSSSEVYGRAKGLLEGVPIAGNLGDQQAALFGQICFEKGSVKNTYGTGCFLLLNTGTEPVHSEHGLLTTLAYQIGNEPPHYALEGSVAIAGALVQWLRDQLGIIKESSDIEALAASVKDNGGVTIVPAFSGLFAPYWREDARGIITGLTGFANKAHLARAALEATAFQTLELLDTMRADIPFEISALKVDGGMVVNELLMQFQADLLGIETLRPKITETTALGAAFAAGLAVGLWPDLKTLEGLWQEARRWSPRLTAEDRESLRVHWKKMVVRSFDLAP